MPTRFFKWTDDGYLFGRRELRHPLDHEGQKLDDPSRNSRGKRIFKALWGCTVL